MDVKKHLSLSETQEAGSRFWDNDSTHAVNSTPDSDPDAR